MLVSSYIVEEEYKESLAIAIKNYSNTNLKEEVIKNYLKNDITIYKDLNKMGTHLNIFMGYVYEILACYEYNTLKNKEKIITIVNPDPTSKTDLLHIIDTGNGFKVVAGGDIKSGSPSYVLNQYEKLLKSKYNIPFIDYSGYLTENRHLLSKKQNDRLERLFKEFPNKRPISSKYSTQDINKIKYDLLLYFDTGLFPINIDNTNHDLSLKKYSNKVSRHILVKNASENRKIVHPLAWQDMKNERFNSMLDIKFANNSSEGSESKATEYNSSSLEFNIEEYHNEISLKEKLYWINEKEIRYKNFKPDKQLGLFKKSYAYLKNFVKYNFFEFRYTRLKNEIEMRIRLKDYSMNTEEILNYFEQIDEAERIRRIEEEEAEATRYKEYEYEYDDYDEEYEDDYDQGYCYYDNNEEQDPRKTPREHQVKEHIRTLRDGKKITVKSHKRGR